MVQQLSDWLANTRFSELLSGMNWFVPAVQTIHILAIAAALALLAMVNARLLGLSPRGPTTPRLAAACLPGFWGALGVLIVTGSLLLIAEPVRELTSPAFLLKMPMVAALGLLTLLLQQGLQRRRWSESKRGRRLAGVVALISTLLCVAIVVAGRLIAYV